MSTITEEIAIPSKWDIIPIHTSDRATFKNCRRRWDWSSPARRNLVRKVRISGVIMPLWFGTGIHYALQKYYNPILSEDPVKVFEEWYNTEWNGGVVHFNDLEQYADRDPVPHNPTVCYDPHTGGEVPSQWYIKGLSELLPDPNEELFEEHRVLGIGMLNFYKEYAAREDNFRVVNVEHTFSVPIVQPNGEVLVTTDNRIMPNWFNRDERWIPQQYSSLKEVHARGRQDAVIQDNDTGQYGILEHKSAIRIDDDYFRHLDLDEQCTTYLWAAEKEAEIYDLEYKKVDFIIYNALRKNFPKPPTMLQSGLPSVDRQKESPTAEMFIKCIKDNGLEMVLEGKPQLQSYYTYLLEQGDKLFIQRGVPGMPYVTRNKAQRENAGKRLYFEAMDMLNDPNIYPNPTKNYSCLNCIFRAPCLMAEDGSDYEFVLNDAYQENYDR